MVRINEPFEIVSAQKKQPKSKRTQLNFEMDRDYLYLLGLGKKHPPKKPKSKQFEKQFRLAFFWQNEKIRQTVFDPFPIDYLNKILDILDIMCTAKSKLGQPNLSSIPVLKGLRVKNHKLKKVPY